jgi:hypothetical protein
MLSDSDISLVYNGIYNIMQDIFGGMSSDYIENNMDCYNSVIRKCHNLYRHIGGWQLIYYTIEDILRREMSNPMSITFEYACKHGMATNPLFVNVPIISKHDFVEFSMNRLGLEHEMYGVDKVASEVLLYRLTHRVLYKLQNTDLSDVEYVIYSLQSICSIIRNTSEFNDIVNRNGVSGHLSYLMYEWFFQYVLVGRNNVTSGVCIPVIVDMIKDVIVNGKFDITQNVLDVLDIPENIHQINSYNEIHNISKSFISEYMNNIKNYENMYYETETEYNIDFSASYNQLVIQTISKLLYAIFDTISFIKTKLDSYYYRDILYSIYEVIYDTVVMMGIRR